MAFPLLISLGIACLIITAVVHSIGGEKYLLRPLFTHRGNHVLNHNLARMVLRFAWHITSVFWLLLAAILYTTAFLETYLGTFVLWSIGATFAAVGVFDLFASRGRHIGWPLLVLTGIFILAATAYK